MKVARSANAQPVRRRLDQAELIEIYDCLSACAEHADNYSRGHYERLLLSLRKMIERHEPPRRESVGAGGVNPETTPRASQSIDDTPRPTDGEILDWLQSLMKREGRWLKLVFSDSRDMGCKQDFLSYWSEGGVDGPTRNGNTIREVISKQMVGAGWNAPHRSRAGSATESELRREPGHGGQP